LRMAWAEAAWLAPSSNKASSQGRSWELIISRKAKLAGLSVVENSTLMSRLVVFNTVR
jgi:hypothetical protein